MKPNLTRIIPFFVAAALAVSGFGQTFGEITGVVTDPSGAVVANATVTSEGPEIGTWNSQGCTRSERSFRTYLWSGPVARTTRTEQRIPDSPRRVDALSPVSGIWVGSAVAQAAVL